MRIVKFLLIGLLVASPVFAEESDDRQTATSLRYVSHELDTRQNKLSAGTNAALTYTNAAGNVEQRTVKSDLTGGTTDTSLPQVNAVNAGLDTKQNDIAAINDHTAVTYTGQTGQIGQKGIYQDDGNYAAQSDNLIDAETFNAALKNGLDNEFVCADRPDARDPNTNLCWLWQIHNDAPVRSPNIFDSHATRIGRWADVLTLLSQTNKPVYCSANVFTGATVGDALKFSTMQNTLAIPFTPGDTFYFKYFGSDTYKSRRQWCTVDSNGIVIERGTTYEYNINSPLTPTLPASYIFIQWANSMTQEQLDKVMIIKGNTPITNFVPYGNVYLPQGPAI